MRRGSIVALLGLALIAGGIATAVAVVPTWLPEDASQQAGRIAFTFWFVIAICIFIFAIVAAVMVYSVIRFRVQEDDFEDGPPVHGHTGLEITWTIIPFILVTAIAIVSAIVLSRNDAQAKDTLRVDVTAQQFTFTFSYPDAGNVTSPVLMLPKGRSVELYMRSLDVIHSVFVPQFSQKEDIVPGLVTQLHITPTRLGTFPLECTELCGLGHSLMRSQAVVMELLRLVRDDADIAKIDSTLKRDPALAFKLLRLVNSAAFGLPVQITSFQHAVMMLGYKKLMRWLSLLLATASKDTNTFPLMHASIRRGMFLEIIGADERQTEIRDELFITGAFSLLDRITGAPFAHLFELISLSESIVDAIVRRSGPYAPYLNLIEAIERSDPIAIRKQADQLALPVGACNQALLKSMTSAELLDAEI